MALAMVASNISLNWTARLQAVEAVVEAEFPMTTLDPPTVLAPDTSFDYVLIINMYMPSWKINKHV